MTFEVGKIYTITKADGTVLTFKFLGGNPLKVEFNGKIYDFLQFTGIFLDIKEVKICII